MAAPHRIVAVRAGQPDLFGNLTAATLNPDELADTVWRLYAARTGAEAVINALAA